MSPPAEPSPSPAPDPPSGVDPRSVPGLLDAPGEASALRTAVAGGGGPAGGPWLVGGGSVLLGLLAFLWLASHRTPQVHDLLPPSEAADAAAVAAPSPPPDVDAVQASARGELPARAAPALALVTPPPVAPMPPPSLLAPPPGPAPAPLARAPVLVVDLAAGPEGAAAPNPAASTAAAGTATRAQSLNANEQFEERLETAKEPERTRATMLRAPSTTVAEGAIIPAVLETALNSDLPGFARAVVSRDVRSFDGSTVLIPRGSRVVGEYRSAAAQGQSRIFVVWTRVLRPDGGSIEIASGGGDELGRAGLAGKVDRHFLERFSGAVLLTVLNAAVYAAAAGNSSTAVVVNSTSGSGGAATSGLLPTDIPPTVKVAQGTPIRIFVQRDLDFTPVGGTP